MKGAIVNCLESLVKEQFGQQAWEKTLEAAGYDKHTLFNMASDIEDKAVLEIISTACKSLRLRPNQMTDAFGDHWVNVYTPKAYSMYCGKAESAREMLLQMDALHKEITSSIEGARPPRFDYEWEDENTLIMHYKSPRGMIGFFAGLIRGVGKYYNEDLKVTKRNETTVSIAFLGKSSTLKSNAPKHQTNIIKKILSLFRSFLFK